DGSGNTKDISRRHQITVSLSGLITITGGKWTTYRKMAEEVMDKAIIVGGLDEKECATKHLPIHGYLKNTDFEAPLYYYGTDRPLIEETILAKDARFKEKLHPRLPYLKGEVLWAVRHEMALNVEDILARRTRALFLDARASMEMAPVVAQIMADELGYSRKWIDRQTKAYQELAEGYLLLKKKRH
ncbi:FAD-dependent oxidoreductase, partial [candidate division KSB1 bacterium]